MLVGSAPSRSPPCVAASCSMNSGLPSAILTTASARSGGAEPADRELARILLGERPEREARVAREASAPALACVEELRPRERDEEQRQAVRPDRERRRSGRAGSSRTSGCPRRRGRSAARAPPPPGNARADEKSASRSAPRPRRRRRRSRRGARPPSRVGVDGRRGAPSSGCAACRSPRPASRSRRSRKAASRGRRARRRPALAVGQRAAEDDPGTTLARDLERIGTTVDLPTPAGPNIETRCGSCSARTRSQMAAKSAARHAADHAQIASRALARPASARVLPAML